MVENNINGSSEINSGSSSLRVNLPQAEEKQIPAINPVMQESRTESSSEPGHRESRAGKIAAVYLKITEKLQFLEFDPLVIVKLLERYVAWNRSILTPEKFEITSNWFAKLGHVMLVAISGLSLLFWIVAAIKQSNGVYILLGFGYAVLLLVLQYTAHKFMNAGKTLVIASTSRLASNAFLDCLSLLAGITGIMAFFLCLSYSEWSYFWRGLAIWIMCDLVAYIALNPSLVNITITRDAGAGEEAIGIFSFFVKAFMRMIPIAFGAGITVFFVALLGGLFALFGRGGSEYDGKASIDHAAIYACLPFAGYIIFALYHLTIDILRSILVIPLKLDQIRNNQGNTRE